MMSDDMRNAVDAADAQASRDPSIFIASNGLRLKLRRVPQMLVLDATKHLRRPRVPKTFDETKQRELENPNDPDYVDALRDFVTTQSLTALNIYLTLGTAAMQPLPAEIEPLESTEWSDMITGLYPEINIPASGPMRRLLWLKYHAVPDEDLNRLLTQIATLGGAVREEDVQRAQETFRSDPAWDAVTGLAHNPEARYGAGSGTSDAGTGARAGTEGSGSIYALPAQQLGDA